MPHLTHAAALYVFIHMYAWGTDSLPFARCGAGRAMESATDEASDLMTYTSCWWRTWAVTKRSQNRHRRTDCDKHWGRQERGDGEALDEGAELTYSGGSPRKEQCLGIKQADGVGRGRGGGHTTDGNACREVHGEF